MLSSRLTCEVSTSNSSMDTVWLLIPLAYSHYLIMYLVILALVTRLVVANDESSGVTAVVKIDRSLCTVVVVSQFQPSCHSPLTLKTNCRQLRPIDIPVYSL
ncbi:hypothetical protein TNCV_2768821 [Trichonephila clavipes]|nr:hypothetical protein TNCV_2768821 [Trichonephila clavipes]